MPAPRRLLLVSQRPLDYGGGGSVRWGYLRRALPERGWEVSTVTARPNPTANETSADPTEARLAALRARVMGAAGAVLGPAARRAGVQPEALAPNGLWALTGRRAVRRAIADVRPHVVWATGPPPSALLAAAAVTRDGSLPLVLELRDLWAGNPYFDAGGRTLARIEARALATADAVVSVTEGCRERLVSLHPEVAPRFELLPNGFDPALLDLRRDGSRSPAAADRRATLIHAGTLYGDRTAAGLLRALDRQGLRERVRVELVGACDPETAAVAAELAHRVPVEMEPPTGWEEAVARTRAADVAVVINSSGTGGDMALPSKLYEALAIGLPVLALTAPGSDTARLLERLGLDAGCADPGDDDAIAAAIERLLDDPPPPVDAETLAPWDRSSIAVRTAALLDRLVDQVAAVPT